MTGLRLRRCRQDPSLATDEEVGRLMLRAGISRRERPGMYASGAEAVRKLSALLLAGGAVLLVLVWAVLQVVG